jgi:alpha-2-macroglobulin
MKNGMGRALALWLVVAGLGWGLPAEARTVRPSNPASAENAQGLQFSANEVQAAAGEDSHEPPSAPSTPLSAEQLQQLFSGLPPIEPQPGDRQPSTLRDSSTPQPRSGVIVPAPWPPPQGDTQLPQDEAGAASDGDLRVLRHSPEGEVQLVPQLSITFSQPMIAVSSQAEASAQVPVKLEPQPPGQWRWVGTRTLLFEPEGGRLPMATEYRGSVPAGTQSALGARLQETREFRFSTPAPRLVRRTPAGGPTVLQPVLLMQFDQHIDPEQVMAHTRLIGPERSAPLLERLDAKAPEVRAALEASETEWIEGRWLALRPVRALARGSLYRLEIAAGLGSLEGPRTTASTQGWSFSTHAELAVERWQCGWQGKIQTDCDPEEGWWVWLNNPLDAGAFDPDSIQVKPEVPEFRAFVYQNQLTTQGRFAPRTEYSLVLPARLRDQFGQSLGRARTLRFATGDGRPLLMAPGTSPVTLDPARPPSYSIYSRGIESLDLEIYRVRPEQWSEFDQWRKQQANQASDAPPPGERIASPQLRPRAVGALSETVLPLEPFLQDGLGHLILRARSKPLASRFHQLERTVWLQSTRIGLVAVHDDQRLTAWASELESGHALAAVELSLGEGKQTDKTDSTGLASLPLPRAKAAPMLVARRGRDAALLTGASYAWGDSPWRAGKGNDVLRWLVFDDRDMYRPGEQVRIKGWLRRLPNDPRGDLQLPRASDKRIRWTLQDSLEVEIAEGEAELSGLGGFDFAIDLPVTPNLGPAQLSLELAGIESVDDEGFEHWLDIQEFRRPEYEVTTEVGAGPHLVGGSVRIEASARYYAGGGLGSAPMQWQLYAWPTTYVPPNRADFSFGDFWPWWRPDFRDREEAQQGVVGQTDGMGRHAIEVKFLGVDPPRPSHFSVEARVTDLNRQSWTSSQELLVHAAAYYVGLKSPRSFVQLGEAIEVEAVVVDVEGALIADGVPALELSRLEWKQQGGQWQEVAEPGPACRPERDAHGHFRCRWTPEEGGSYRVDALVQDVQGRSNGSELRIWVAGGEAPPVRGVELQELLLVPDHKDLRPGETLKVLVQAPFEPAEGLMTLVRGGVLEQRRFDLAQGSATLEVPILESMVPGFELRVDVVGRAARIDAQGRAVGRRPAAASGTLQVSVPPLARTLAVSASPRQAVLAPGAGTVIDLEVHDAKGLPVADAELAVVVVDEAVLALSGYRLPDPLAVFYEVWPSRVQAQYQATQVVLGALSTDPPGVSDADYGEDSALDRIEVTGSRIRRSDIVALDAPVPPPAPPAVGAAAENATVALRSNFNALALFAPAVRTDPAGRAEVEFTLPDSLTRYRIMVVAVSGAREFGYAESSLTARKPLMLRPSPPRFLNVGDRIELPLLVQNQTDAPLQVELGVRAENARILDAIVTSGAGNDAGGAGRLLTVPAQDRVEVRIPIAAESSGRARFQALVRAGSESDAQSFELPVWTPATREAFATYGSLDEQSVQVQPVRRPVDVDARFGGLQISLASTELQALTDAFLFLVEYPFECNEQRASRVLGISALRDVLSAFGNSDLPTPEALEASMRRDLQHLASQQNWDGGWGFWRQDASSWPYLSVHVAHALARASDKGFGLSNETRSQALAYLRSIERKLPDWYHPETRRSLRAYALDVRRRLGDADPAAATKLLAEVRSFDELSIEAIGWLLPSLDAPGSHEQFEALLRHVEQQVSEAAGTAQFITARSEQGEHVLLHSDRRADGVMLEALLHVRPEDDLIEKLARGLLAHRVKGRWSNTQDNAFVLLAMERYFRQREGTRPDFSARVWLGQRFAGEHAFRGRSTERVELRIPMAELASADTAQPLTLQKQGSGRLYYRFGLDYVPQSLALEAADHGFAVQRRYAAVDDPSDVRRDAEGLWRIRAGARVRVELTMVATARRYHVALVDALPAGLEAINPALAVSEALPEDPNKVDPQKYWKPDWFEHQNLRNERVEAFTSLLWEGVHRYSYVARATTPGEFSVPPARAEEMYQPETFGRSGTDRVVVESRD